MMFYPKMRGHTLFSTIVTVMMFYPKMRGHTLFSTIVTVMMFYPKMRGHTLFSTIVTVMMFYPKMRGNTLFPTIVTVMMIKPCTFETFLRTSKGSRPSILGAYHSALQEMPSPSTEIFMFPLIPGPSQDYSSIYSALKQAQYISVWCIGDLSKTIVTLDLDLYARAPKLV